MVYPVAVPIATAVGEFAAPYLIKEATKLGIKKFIQNYGSTAFQAISAGVVGGMIEQVTAPLDLQKEKLFGMPVSRITGQEQVYSDIEEPKKIEPLGYIDTVHGGKGPLPPIKAEPFPAETKVKTWDESFKAPEKIETTKGLEIPPQEIKIPPGIQKAEPLGTDILTKDKPKDITKQTKDLVTKEPEFGALTETEKQTAIALKGDKPDYYSRVVRAVEGSQEIATADQWLGIIQGQGATEAELDYLGLTKLLKGEEKITKENLLKHIKEKDISSRITTTQIPDKDREIIEYEHYRLKGTDSDTFETYVMQFDVTKDEEGKYLPHDEPIIYRADASHIGKEQYGRNTFLTLRTQVGYQPSFIHEGTEKTTEHNKWAIEIGKLFEKTLIGDEIQLDLVQRGRLTGFEKDFDAVKGSDLIAYLDKNKIKYEIETYEAEGAGTQKSGFLGEHDQRIILYKAGAQDADAKIFTPNSIYIFGHPIKLKAVGEGEAAGFMRYDDQRIDRTKPKEFKKRVTPNAWTGKLSDHIPLLPNFPITSDTKGAELGLMELIRIAVENGNDSIAIPSGQILADRYSGKENLKVWQDKIQLGVLQKIAKRNNTTVTEHVIRKKKEFTKESGLHVEGTVDWMSEAKEQGHSLKKISREELKDLLNNYSSIPDFISMMTENAYSRNIGNIGDELSIESSQDKSYYIWQDSTGLIKFELPIVGANEAEEYMANEQRDIETSAYVEGLSEDFTERTYLEYLFNRIEEYQGKVKSTREDHKLYKMKIPKSLQNKILSESLKFTELDKQKLPIEDQTQRLFT